MGGTVIALSVQECNAVEIAPAMRLAGRGLFTRGARLRPALAMGGTALRVMAVALLSTPMVAAAVVLFLLVRPMRPMLLMRLKGLLRPRLRVPAAIGRLDRRAEQFLDIAEIRPLLMIAERDGDALGARPRGAADAVDVAFRHVRQIEVDHVRDVVDVEPARRDIGRDQR